MVTDYLNEVWIILLELSPALLAGLLLAGILHVILPSGFIHRMMNKPGFRSTLRAVLIGVPMPLCSCGVVPTALGLKQDGASKGATTGFLISTPQTGVDSILVSAAFLGWPFAIFKLVAAFVTGLIGGMIADYVEPPEKDSEQAHHLTSEDSEDRTGIVEVLRYSVVELYGAIDRWIIAGVLVAAAITALLPEHFFHELSWAQGMTGMLLMLAVSIPLYICTTGSVPIAASFVAAGMPTGTALVFLMAGPATNMATIGALYRALGGRLLAVYLGTVVVMSIGFGLTFDFILGEAGTVHMHDHSDDWLGIISAIILIALTIGLFVHRYIQRKQKLSGKGQFNTYEEFDMGLTLKVEGMSCQHCTASVEKSLKAVEGVVDAVADLETGDVLITGEDLNEEALAAAVKLAGYQVKS
ncbi:MAG: hypothetical protein EP297_07875 [Gammaproteobacteria bacterium]|nr:MAG: hypothetical protein EP297_07875 [Gammaproteobacteria bacterium]